MRPTSAAVPNFEVARGDHDNPQRHHRQKIQSRLGLRHIGGQATTGVVNGSIVTGTLG